MSEKMIFWIRADGNAQIGAGHLMRCMAIGKELAGQEGCDGVCFLCADRQSASMAEEHRFQSYVLGTDYRDMESELPLWRKLTAKSSIREAAMTGKLVFLIDSYYITDKYLKALGQMGYTVLLDDFGTHCHPVDCVINYNAPASLKAYRELYQEQNTRLLIGSKYVPLRRQFRTVGQFCTVGQFSTAGGSEIAEQFSAAGGSETTGQFRAAEPPVSGTESGIQARTVLITTGGGDSENIAGEILRELYTDGLEFHLVMGQFNPHFQEMKAMEKIHANIHIHHNVVNMAMLMGCCDIALTAGGSTIYELAAVGVPFICFSYAQNQEQLTEYVGREQIAGYAGAWHKEPKATLERIKKLFWELATDRNMRISYSCREQTLADGRGAERIACALTAGRWEERQDEGI